VSVRGDLVTLVVDSLLDATSAERNVYLARTDAIPIGTIKAILVRLSGAEEIDERASEETEARRLPVQVVAFARTVEALISLSEEVDDVMLVLHREAILRDLPLPTFGDSQGEDPRPEKPYWIATYELRIPYRVSIDDPSREA
jgi:hypothetical protein